MHGTPRRYAQTNLGPAPIDKIVPKDNSLQNWEPGQAKPFTSRRVGDSCQHGKFFSVESLIQTPSFQNVFKRHLAKLYILRHRVCGHANPEIDGAHLRQCSDAGIAPCLRQSKETGKANRESSPQTQTNPELRQMNFLEIRPVKNGSTGTERRRADGLRADVAASREWLKK